MPTNDLFYVIEWRADAKYKASDAIAKYKSEAYANRRAKVLVASGRNIVVRSTPYVS